MKYPKLKSVVYQGTTKRGATCQFFPINDKWAIKIYGNRVDRDFCYEMQKRCAIYNLAPNVGGTVDIGQYEYGYITEIAETIVECDNHNRSELLSIRDSLSFEIELLKMKYRNIMVIAEDLHVKNLARKNGELISIDFDCFTMAY